MADIVSIRYEGELLALIIPLITVLMAYSSSLLEPFPSSLAT